MFAWDSKLIPAQVRDDIEKSNLRDVVFDDPLREETRKAKRNLVAASFAALLIALFQLEVTGILGLTANRPLGSEMVQGLACLVVLYFLVGFCFAAYVDYVAWKFQRERVLITPFLALLELIEANDRALREQLANATESLNQMPWEGITRAGVEPSGRLKNATAEGLGQLSAIRKHRDALASELGPLLKDWRSRVNEARRLTWRLIARFLSLWVLDLIVPYALGLIAVFKTSAGIIPVLTKALALN